ncbi:hypothetical protein QTP88_005281 [Uroleucon formosanum]
MYPGNSDSIEYEVEKIIIHQKIYDKILYFIKWKNCGLNENTWEPEENLVNCPDILNDYKSKNNLLKKKK